MAKLKSTLYCLNAKYSGNETPLQVTGCATVAAGSAASYYAQKKYSVATETNDLKTAGLYKNVYNDTLKRYEAQCQWSWNTSVGTGATFTEHSVDFYKKLREEIDADRPVIVEIGSGHWVMVYEYVGTGDSAEKINVLDSAGYSQYTTGEYRTLKEAATWSGVSSNITRMKITAKKV